MHDDLDLNWHGIHEVLSFRGDILLHKHLDLNGQRLTNGGPLLFRVENGVIRFFKPALLVNTTFQIQSDILKYTHSTWDFFIMESFWVTNPVHTRIAELRVVFNSLLPQETLGL